ncbi:hypothetical protein M407DRAFT_223829 [Tulasnella calospora MUT 4182]|uniref:Uncharacterized protein n=1 Tax=Tulasnella calospora MUT 4182 TaxID=1051891 RepID=A0A0C3QY80_9AGAM|nr:hypothetical protein M407DRAFT_223829 [Tulasnella calospora MUT 4182]
MVQESIKVEVEGLYKKEPSLGFEQLLSGGSRLDHCGLRLDETQLRLEPQPSRNRQPGGQTYGDYCRGLETVFPEKEEILRGCLISRALRNDSQQQAGQLQGLAYGAVAGEHTGRR